jgi:hypothetical protein
MKCDPRTRVAIVGTAPSWRDCPWTDPGLFIIGLNDAYTLNFPRVDAWFDLHPFDRLYFRKREARVVYAEDIPHGAYVRPEGHIETLKQMARSIPVFLQADPPAGWPAHAQRFPIEAMTAQFGDYWASGPAYEIAWAIEQGAEEIQIWGIHLSTEHEYREQRANFEHLLGIARGKGIKVVMADASPVMKHPWRYAYEPHPEPHPAAVRLQRIAQAKKQLVSELAQWPRWKSKTAALDRLRRVQAQEADCQRTLGHAQTGSTIVAPVFGA